MTTDNGVAPESSEQRLDTDALHTIVLGRWPQQRLRARARATDPAFHKPEHASLAEHRQTTLNQLKLLVDDSKGNPG